MEEKIKIVIIEDDAILREGYALLIGKTPGFEVVNSYYSYDDATYRLLNDRPHVILLDIQMPGTNGLDAIPEIKAMLPDCRIVMLTVYEFEDSIIRAFANGASGYLTKDTPMANIIETINEIMAGFKPINKNLARLISRLFKKNKYQGISPTENRVLELLSTGKGKSQISKELFLATDAVYTSVNTIHENFLVSISAM
jgi:DNA-binding NarL/FixJ family response regulator